MVTDAEKHSIRAIGLMIRLALSEQRYHEVAVLMHERTNRIQRLAMTGASHKDIILELMLDTSELERQINQHVKQVTDSQRAFAEMIPARRAYAQSGDQRTYNKVGF